jgi:hypothetical protein
MGEVEIPWEGKREDFLRRKESGRTPSPGSLSGLESPRY